MRPATGSAPTSLALPLVELDSSRVDDGSPLGGLVLDEICERRGPRLTGADMLADKLPLILWIAMDRGKRVLKALDDARRRFRENGKTEPDLANHARKAGL